MKQKIILSIIALVLIINGIYLLFHQATLNKQSDNLSTTTLNTDTVNLITTTSTTKTTSSRRNVGAPLLAPNRSPGQAPEEAPRVNDSSTPPINSVPPSTQKYQTIPVSLNLQSNILNLNQSYQFAIPPNSNVIEAMRALASQSNFRFESQGFTGLGEFIKSINNIPNQLGAYWTLYLNHKYSDSGASNVKLQANDLVTWKLEKK